MPPPEGSAVLSSAEGMTEWMSLVASVGILNVQMCASDPLNQAYIELLFLTSGIGNAGLSLDECGIPANHTWHFRW